MKRYAWLIVAAVAVVLIVVLTRKTYQRANTPAANQGGV